MAIVWADFPSGDQGLYGTDESLMLNGVWAQIIGDIGSSVTLTSDPDPNIGAAGNVLRVRGGASATGVRIVNPAGAQATSGIAFRLWPDELPAANSGNSNPQWEFRTSGNLLIARCRVLSDGSIAAYNSAGTLIGSASLPVIAANSYSHIESKIVRDAAAGTIEVRVNGASVLTLTGVALGANNIGIIYLGTDSGVTGAFSYYKDFVYWDGTGSQNNDFLGSVSVYALRPVSDVSFNWTASTGSTGWNLIDESPPVDTDFISASNALPAASVFEIENLPPDIVAVKALLPVTRSKKIDGGDGNLQTGLTGTLTDLGADKPITIAFTYNWDVSELSPDTGVAWTPSEVDAVKLQVDRTL